MSSFSVISEFGLDEQSVGEAITTDPHWVLAVIRFANPITYDRTARASFSTLFEDAVQIRGQPLVITDSCVQLSTTSSKGTHLSSFSAALLPDPDLNYLAELMPGDWLLAWIVNGKQAADSIITRIRRSQPCNGFSDGLKFVGRINSVRKVINQESGIGLRQTRYNLTGAGFTEFDSTLFYEPHLAEKIPTLGRIWARIGATFNDIIRDGGQGLNVNKMIPFFLDLLLGRGVTQNLGLPSLAQLQSTTGLEAPYSYIVPTVVGQLLGKSEKSKSGGLLAVADILELLWGVQNYDDFEIGEDELKLIAMEDGNASDIRAGQLFNPRGTRGGGSRRYTGTEMMGTFLPTPPQFTDKSVWSVLNQYLNPATNEMYTCLRVNAEGNVVPTLVLRQLPFTTELGPTDISTTKFLELPRWHLHPHLVKRADIGRSDALRLNFCHVYGDIGTVKNNMYNGQVVRYPPLRDDLDIARSGLRPYSMTVPCSDVDVREGGPAKWMSLLGDIVMGQHMTLTGIIETVGIQSPICPGDNVAWDNAVFHIETVTHTASITATGTKDFTTSLTVSHGVASVPLDLETPIGLYAGIGVDDQRLHEARVSSERDLNPGRLGDSQEGTARTRDSGAPLELVREDGALS